MKSLLKLLVLAVLFVSMTTTILAQNSKRTTAWNYLKEKEYEKALEAINEAIKHEKTQNDPKTWHFRAVIFHDIAVSQDTAHKGIVENPLEKSLESIKKSMSFDEKERYIEKNKRILLDLATLFFNEGVEYYNYGINNTSDDDFRTSLGKFESYFESMRILGEWSAWVKKTLVESGIDPNDVLLYAGIAAQQVNDIDKAKKYFTALTKLKYQQVSPYLGLTDIYLDEGDTNAALEVVEMGKLNVADENEKKNITIKELLIYQSMGKLELLTQKLEKAIQEDPQNVNLAITLGETYYAISLYHYTQAELTEENLNEGMPKENVLAAYGAPTSKVIIEEKGIERIFYDKKSLDFKDGKLVAWKVDVKGKDEVDHLKMSEEFQRKAIDKYIESLEMTDDEELLFALNSKIGTIIYNAGVDVYNKAVKERDEKKAKLLEDKYMALFDEAIPYMKKAMELKEDDKTHIPHLKKIYLLKGDMEKFNELNEK